MFTKTTIALSAAFVLGTACLAPAMAKDRAHHHQGSTVQLQVSNEAYVSNGYSPALPNGSSGRIPEPAYMAIQTRGFREHN